MTGEGTTCLTPLRRVLTSDDGEHCCRVLIMSTPDEPGDMPAADNRLRRIESVTDSALAHLNVDDLLAELLERVRASLRSTRWRCCCWMPTTSSLLLRRRRGSRRRSDRGFEFRWGGVSLVGSRRRRVAEKIAINPTGHRCLSGKLGAGTPMDPGNHGMRQVLLLVKNASRTIAVSVVSPHARPGFPCSSFPGTGAAIIRPPKR